VYWFWYPFAPWEFEAALRVSCDRTSGSHDGGEHRPGCGYAEPPTTIDVRLIQVAYEFIAAESGCARCGAPLGRGLRVTPPVSGGPPSHWRVSVVTRCLGWRRHRHTAHVTRPLKDLALGPLQPR
jgi:hypothetical protein